jgi:hypothetical protein
MASSHPGVGIVIDSKKNVYYTDLTHVWKIAPDGKKSIVVRNVHTHELYIDPHDTLYGEHLWYNGESSNTWGHRVWRLAPDGKLDDIIPARAGFREDYGDFSCVRDWEGAMYWALRGNPTLVKKRSRDGSTSVLASASFTDVRKITVTPDGIVYLIDLYDLVRINPDGSHRTVAKSLAAWNAARLTGPDRNAIMGLWTDSRGNVYTAVATDGLVKKIAPDGAVSIAATTSYPWSPSGGLVTPEGALWILEFSVTNAVRVSRIDARGTTTVFE